MKTLWVAALVILVGGCSSGADHSSHANGDGSESPADMRPGTAADLAPSTVHLGSVIIVNTTRPAPQYTAVSSFYEFTTAAESVCTEEPMGVCVVRTCPVATPTPTLTYVGVGPVKIKGGTKTVTIPAWTPTTAASVTEPTVLWSGGETLTISAPGASAPGFSLTLEAPETATVTSPVLNGDSLELTVNRSVDLPFTWTGGANTKVTVSLYAYKNNQQTVVTVTCTTDGSTGSVTMPKTALAKLPPAQKAAQLSVVLQTTTELSVDQWVIRGFTVQMAAANATHEYASGSITIE